MAAIVLLIPAAQAYADEALYISEVKVGAGESGLEAASALEGYIILSDDSGNPVDLNNDAGGGWGSKGDRVVYLGYKTTTDRKDAITDLAVMNMNGGYNVQEYEILMETQMKEQIIPFVGNFQAAIDEYRENYNSPYPDNRARARYVHDVLNTMLDDDTGKLLGDLLLNRTRYEIGDAAYDALSDAEKAEHADILTIIAQSNGKATLSMESLLTQAADTAESTWLERFAETTYEDLAEETELTPTDAAGELALRYSDGANKILAMWDGFREELLGYQQSLENLSALDTDTLAEELAAPDTLTEQTDGKEAAEILIRAADAKNQSIQAMADATLVAVYHCLEETEYEGGTLLDFFMRDYSEVNANMESLYPLVASLSEGQRAGLDFVSLKELMTIALTDAEGYAGNDALSSAELLSIYDGVDRGIYQKGGVALTSDAMRKQNAAAEAGSTEDSMFAPWTTRMMAITGAAFLAFSISTGAKIYWAVAARNTERQLEDAVDSMVKLTNAYNDQIFPEEWEAEAMEYVEQAEADLLRVSDNFTRATANSALCTKLITGFGVAMVILAGITTYLSYRDLCDYYDVEFTPIPHYMVDEKDIIAYNSNGEKIVLKNQPAYYKAVTCNRTPSDEMWDTSGDCADLNGDVGKQWIALYAVKNEEMEPILADSLKAVVNSDTVPSGYKTGIHMFGSDAAFNMNNEMYVWNSSADKVFVYFKTREGITAATAGSVFTGGQIALVAAGGFAAGLVIGLLGMSILKKRKNNGSRGQVVP